MTSIRNSEIGRRLSTWRRLMLLFGPSSAKKVGLALAEFAWPDKCDPEAPLVARNCTQEILCGLCDYSAPRGLRKQLAVLEDAGWICRDDDQTGPGVYRKYELRIPEWVSKDAIAEMMTPSKGMWKRALQAPTARTGESQIRCFQSPVKNHRGISIPQKSVSEEPQFEIGGTSVPEQVPVGSPLKELVSSPLGGKGKGDIPLRESPKEKGNDEVHVSGQPEFDVMLEACMAAGLRGSQWVDISLIIESDFGFTPSPNQIRELERQIRDRRRD